MLLDIASESETATLKPELRLKNVASANGAFPGLIVFR